MDIKSAIQAALQNVAGHGDTDIFPFPFENFSFRDRRDEVATILEKFHGDFEHWLATYPPQTMPTLTQVGYTGFRWATQIDPFWNAYYLALVIGVADQIEAQRIEPNSEAVFSYRYEWNAAESKLFKDSTWIDYRKRCIALSHKYPVIVQTDISDFYPRIYHHRIENALKRLPNPGDTPHRIMSLLSSFSKNVSYGLPIGGPASRILAELALVGVDKLLARQGIVFCRYVDDFSVFCSDKAEAYRILVFLSEKLANEGLTLQKKKTRILTAEEFRQTSQLLDPAELGNKLATDEQKLLNISLQFDPYSPTAVADYDALKDAVSKIDVVGILGREIGKTAIDPAVAKQAINSILALDAPQQNEAMRMLLDSENLMVLAPVFVTVMRVIRDLYDHCEPDFQKHVDDALCNLATQKSPPLSVEVNLAYYLKALSGNQTQRKEELLVRLFEDVPNPLIRRLIILIMTKWGCHYWLSDVRNKYGAMSLFERRAFIVASYFLGDEGKHWRHHTKSTWLAPELFIREWFSSRFATNKSVPL